MNSSNLLHTLDQALLVAQDLLIRFTYDTNFARKLALAFGNEFNITQAQSLIEDLSTSNSLVLPKFELRPVAELYGARGAFAGQTNTIYIAQEFLQEDVNNISEIVAVLLEELGHAIDLQLNKTDTKGDEGKLFSTLVRGGELNQAELQHIKTADDGAVIPIDGASIEIERSSVLIQGDETGFVALNSTAVSHNSEELSLDNLEGGENLLQVTHDDGINQAGNRLVNTIAEDEFDLGTEDNSQSVILNSGATQAIKAENEGLYLSTLASASVLANNAEGVLDLPKNLSRISSDLLQLANSFAISGMTSVFQSQAKEPASGYDWMTFDDKGTSVNVRITASDVNGLLATVEGIGFEATGAMPDLHFLEGFLPIAALSEVESFADRGLLGVMPVYRPITNVGLVTSQADFVHETNRVRFALGSMA